MSALPRPINKQGAVKSRWRPVAQEKTCEHCGNAFTTIRADQRFCGYRCSNLGQPRRAQHPPASVRFWALVDTGGGEGGCWPWRGRRSGDYGRFSPSHGQTVLAHRYAYEDRVGRIPDGLVIDHLCRNPVCVRPDHLEPVTPGENVRRGAPYNALLCAGGHFIDDATTTYNEHGHRRCRTCDRDAHRRRNAERVWVVCPSCNRGRFAGPRQLLRAARCRSCASQERHP